MYMERLESSEIEAGIYTWSMEDDRLYGDTAVAALFGLDPLQTVRGLPLASYMERVHMDDRPGLAALIAKAVRDGRSHNAEYRVRNAHGEFEFVMSSGRCFHGPDGTPAIYSGIIYPLQKLN